MFVMKFLTLLSNSFYTIRMLFSAVTSKPQKYLKDIERSYLECDIPGYRTDRKNLKNDRDLILGDYSKAFSEKYLEYYS